MTEEIVQCPHCNCNVHPKRLKSHINKRCPKSPVAIQNKALAAAPRKATASELPKNVLIRARLERLFRDLSSNASHPDDQELAKIFTSFYYMYVWQGDRRSADPSRKVIDSNGEYARSIHTVSGGLPSLGKGSK